MTALTQEFLAELRADAAADPGLKVARNAVMSVGVAKAALDHDKLVAINPATEIKLDTLGVTDQMHSGRCWMFAALNAFRHRTAKSLNVEKFEFSYTYLLFFDKLERVNFYVQALTENPAQDWDDREMYALLDAPSSDGGWFNTFANLASKYGVVPAQVMPETHSSGHTRELNRALCTIIRRAVLQARSGAIAADAALAGAVRDAQRVLAVHLGTPPDPAAEFEWAYRTKDDEFQTIRTTPAQFAAEYLGDLTEYVTLTADPREDNELHRVYTAPTANNMAGGQAYTHLNVSSEELAAAAQASLDADEPVWFGCDVDRNFSFIDGVWDEGLVATDALYGIDSTTTKEERLLTFGTSVTHAMLLVGTARDSHGARRWRVENSWGPTDPRTKDPIPGNGLATMTQDWFDENVFEVVVRRAFLTPEQLAALETEPIALPAHDRIL
ncbi:C1 family peptidase [uncultured Corynebacterium sp.]|uniref:aminopeptidase C n=1 Tax=uncultured Corynebacterium sp. TaxID=159447 RepID=UPI0025F3CCFE|nr:C1 family peptidase [uncultured Corynebacterium sp.]